LANRTFKKSQSHFVLNLSKRKIRREKIPQWQYYVSLKIFQVNLKTPQITFEKIYSLTGKSTKNVMELL
jgi:hypothetical protein